MECSVQVFPRTDALKRELGIPLVVAAAPSRDGVADRLDLQTEELHVCRICRAYLTSHCKVNEGKWECSICGTLNAISSKEVASLQSSAGYEVVVKSRPEMGPIFAVYLSLHFENFEAAKKECAAVLEKLPENGKCLVFLGMDRSPFMILVPPGKPEHEDAKSLNPFSSSFEVGEVKRVAAIARFASFEAFIGLDLANFFFDKDTIEAGKEALMQLKPAMERDAVAKSLQLAGTLANVLNGTPMRFIAFLEEIQADPRFFEMLRRFPVRIDFMIAKMTKQALQMQKEIPGTINLISSETIETVMRQKTSYQVFCRCRANKAAIEWKPSKNGYAETREQNLFSPICVDDQSFAFNVNILPNQDRFVFQLTSKFVIAEADRTSVILRVLSNEYKTSESLQEILDSVNKSIIES